MFGRKDMNKDELFEIAKVKEKDKINFQEIRVMM